MDTTGKIYITIAAVALIGLMAAFWQVSRRLPKGTLLAIGIGLWVVGQAISRTSTREMKLIGGICTLGGFVGGLLGLFDVFRKKKEIVASTPQAGGAETQGEPSQKDT